MKRAHLPHLAVAVSLALSATGALAAETPAHFPLLGPHVYVMSNAADGNAIADLQRDLFGKLVNTGVTATGGLGVGVGTTAPPPDPLGSQNSLQLSEDGRWLFAVNAGSNDISVLDVRHRRPSVVGVFPSGGTYPVSLAQAGHSLYVLNSAGAGSISTFRITDGGYLVATVDGTRSIGTQVPLQGNQPNVGNTASQIEVDPSGQWLVVTIKHAGGQGSIETFRIGRDGTLAATPTTTPSSDPAPFGFGFDRLGHVLVSEAGANAVSSYAIGRNGTLATLDASVPDGQAASCWLATRGQFAYVANAGSSTISGYVADARGQLRLTHKDGVAAALGAGRAPTDLKVSGDGATLVVNETGAGAVASFFILPNGDLVKLGETPVFAPLSGTQGLAVQ
ncbi:lactonase family protein [Luteibacter aegosomaticola]|uniref:lactonase family protein n=1 Tax=Luteibacter aegosomaticola TaxID=2911538 RepID=UPI001FFB95C5|nr:beta-propeller fold lactonase family protein [Luteibacter aegosomaticola]UPG92153.1 lactonase family protein [Luteibacter aegosomaticola]